VITVGNAGSMVDVERNREIFECCVCLEPLVLPVTHPCQHSACYFCAHSMFDNGFTTCPLCFRQVPRPENYNHTWQGMIKMDLRNDDEYMTRYNLQLHQYMESKEQKRRLGRGRGRARGRGREGSGPGRGRGKRDVSVAPPKSPNKSHEQYRYKRGGGKSIPSADDRKVAEKKEEIDFDIMFEIPDEIRNLDAPKSSSEVQRDSASDSAKKKHIDSTKKKEFSKPHMPRFKEKIPDCTDVDGMRIISWAARNTWLVLYMLKSGDEQARSCMFRAIIEGCQVWFRVREGKFDAAEVWPQNRMRSPPPPRPAVQKGSEKVAKAPLVRSFVESTLKEKKPKNSVPKKSRSRAYASG